MWRRLCAGLLGLLVMVVLATAWWRVVNTASAASTGQALAVDQPPERERETDPNLPEISFIDSPTAQCVMPEPHKDTCYVQWSYLYVNATSPNYIISMTVTLDNRLRAYYSGFFQTSMYAPFDMHSPGFRVACGPPGSGGNPALGRSYAYTIRARETGGLRAANYGSVNCPADVVPVASLSLTGPAVGITGIPYNFTANLSPITTTLPVNYGWHVTDQTPVTVTQNLSSVRSITWNTPGLKQVRVVAYNPAGSVTDTRYITVVYQVFMPLTVDLGLPLR